MATFAADHGGNEPGSNEPGSREHGSRETAEGPRFEFTSLSSLVGAFEAFTDDLSPAKRIEACHIVTSCCEAIRTEAAAEFVSSNGDTRAAERALANRKSSRRQTKRDAKRAAAAAKNPTIADKMKSGELSGEQVDAVVRADAKTKGAASADDSLLDELGKASADRTNKIIDKFIVDQAEADTAQKEHDRQRRLRDVRKHKTGTGLGAITIEGDQPFIDAMHKQLLADANRLYQLDGGRDVRNSEHQRTHGQRVYDAAYARICGVGNSSTSSGANRVTRTGSTAAASRRPTIVAAVSLAKLTGQDPSLVAEQIGTGPIADSVLAAYLGDTAVGVDLVGALFGNDGELLWLGRKARYASGAQFLALIIRDKGCVLCDAGVDRCQAHHRIPWSAPAKGETNLDDLVLVCDDCHHRLHEQNQTLYRHEATGEWKLRPATAAETPPPRPDSQRPNNQRPKRQPAKTTSERRAKPAPTGDRPHSSTTARQQTSDDQSSPDAEERGEATEERGEAA